MIFYFRCDEKFVHATMIFLFHGNVSLSFVCKRPKKTKSSRYLRLSSHKYLCKSAIYITLKKRTILRRIFRVRVIWMIRKQLAHAWRQLRIFDVTTWIWKIFVICAKIRDREIKREKTENPNECYVYESIKTMGYAWLW